MADNMSISNNTQGSTNSGVGADSVRITLTEDVDFSSGGPVIRNAASTTYLNATQLLEALKAANPQVPEAAWESGRIPAGTVLNLPCDQGVTRAEWFETQNENFLYVMGGRNGGRLFGDARMEGREGTDYRTVNTADISGPGLRTLIASNDDTARAIAAYNGISIDRLEDVLNGTWNISSTGTTIRLPLTDPFTGTTISYGDREMPAPVAEVSAPPLENVIGTRVIPDNDIATADNNDFGAAPTASRDMLAAQAVLTEYGRGYADQNAQIATLTTAPDGALSDMTAADLNKMLDALAVYNTGAITGENIEYIARQEGLTIPDSWMIGDDVNPAVVAIIDPIGRQRQGLEALREDARLTAPGVNSLEFSPAVFEAIRAGVAPVLDGESVNVGDAVRAASQQEVPGLYAASQGEMRSLIGASRDYANAMQTMETALQTVDADHLEAATTYNASYIEALRNGDDTPEIPAALRANSALRAQIEALNAATDAAMAAEAALKTQVGVTGVTGSRADENSEFRRYADSIAGANPVDEAAVGAALNAARPGLGDDNSRTVAAALARPTASAGERFSTNGSFATDRAAYETMITEVQNALKAMGHNLGNFGEDGVDGVWGPVTEAQFVAALDALGLNADVSPEDFLAAAATRIAGEDRTLVTGDMEITDPSAALRLNAASFAEDRTIDFGAGRDIATIKFDGVEVSAVERNGNNVTLTVGSGDAERTITLQNVEGVVFEENDQALNTVPNLATTEISR